MRRRESVNYENNTSDQFVRWIRKTEEEEEGNIIIPREVMKNNMLKEILFFFI